MGGLKNIQNTGAGQLIGVTAQSQVQSQSGQILPGSVFIDGICGICQCPVQRGAEVGIQLLRRFVAGLSGGQQNPGIPHGENLFQRGDGGKISQMNGTIAFAVCPGDQPLLDIVVDHGGGESLPFVKVDQLPGHIGNDLVHIQRNIRQFLPGSGTLALQALL